MNATLWSVSTRSEWWPRSSSQTPLTKIIAVVATSTGARSAQRELGGPLATYAGAPV